MIDSPKNEGQAGLKKILRDQSLCTNCTACVNLCPYMDHHQDHTVTLHNCDQPSGRCFQYCPRTPTDLKALQQNLFEAVDITPEIGAFKGLYMTRATDEKIRENAQHGGTATALMTLALEEGFIDEAILAGKGNQFLADSNCVKTSDDISSNAGSQFVTAPTVATFNKVSAGDSQKIGIVATPCQSLALAKMKVNAPQTDRERVDKLKLVISLFCGWALDWKKMTALLKNKIGNVKILGIDIPPSKHACMEVYTDSGTLEIPIDEVNECVRDNCKYCFDMTGEFSDISVGSARSSEGWAIDKKWNQVIVRTQLGQTLMNLAREHRVLEFKKVPPENLEKLKKASMNKKRQCINALIEKSGSQDDLIYLDIGDKW
jgi:coenzyme F420 hydrogenase subunit beta